MKKNRLRPGPHSTQKPKSEMYKLMNNCVFKENYGPCF